MQQEGREIAPEDMPPALEWEAPIWTLYERLHTQWRYKSTTTHTGDGIAITSSVACGLDYNPAIALMERWGWDIDMGLQMLQIVELEVIHPGKD